MMRHFAIAVLFSVLIFSPGVAANEPQVRAGPACVMVQETSFDFSDIPNKLPVGFDDGQEGAVTYEFVPSPVKGIIQSQATASSGNPYEVEGLLIVQGICYLLEEVLDCVNEIVGTPSPATVEDCQDSIS